MAMYLHRLIVRRKYAWLGLLTHSTAGHDNGRNRQRSSPSPRLRRPQHQPRTALFSDGSPDVDLSPNDEQLVRSSARLRSDHDLQVLALEGRDLAPAQTREGGQEDQCAEPVGHLCRQREDLGCSAGHSRRGPTVALSLAQPRN